MRRKAIWRGLGVGLLILAGLAVVLWWWIIPSAIIGRLEAIQGGRVAIQGFWIGRGGSGVTGLTFYETRAADAPVWATAERVETDLSLGGMLRGRFTPGRVTIIRPEATLRLDQQGGVLTPWTPAENRGIPLPTLAIQDGRARVNQDGRPELYVKAIDGTFETRDDRFVLKAKTQDPMWGRWRADGSFDAAFQAGKIELSGLGIPSSRDKVRTIPWVSPSVWDQLSPEGPLDARVAVILDAKSPQPWQTRTWGALRGTNVTLPALGLEIQAAQGEIRFEAGVTKFDRCHGSALDGTVGVDGTLDFNPKVPVLDLDVRLDGVDVADAPKTWQLDTIELTAGRLAGKAHIRALFPPDQVDLTGSSGEAVITGGRLQDIPVKSMKIGMRAEGRSLRYETADPADSATDPKPPPPPAEPAAPAPEARSGFGLGLFGGKASGGQSVSSRLLRGAQVMSSLAALKTLSPTSRVVLPIDSLVALQVPPANDDPAPDDKPPAFQLPRTLSSEFELEDVDLRKIVDRAERVGLKLPFDVAGRLSIKAKAKIPLGTLADLKAYRFEGEGTLVGASIGGVDLGRVEARILLADGVLELTDFRGRLIDRPGGSAANPPEPDGPIAAEGPLPEGGFRATVRAELSPKGRLTSTIEGNALPVGELAAPALPRPTPLGGRLSLNASAEAAVDRLTDPAAWVAAGKLDSTKITYDQATLDSVAADFALKDGHLTIPDLAARLGDRPLAVALGLALKTPFDFDATIDIEDWELADALRFLPAVPQSSPIGGRLRANAQATGTLEPRRIQTRGDGRITSLRAGPVPLGDLPIRWATEGDIIRAHVVDASILGGRLAANLDFPTSPGPLARGSAVFRGIDTARLARHLPGGPFRIAGAADGDLEFVAPTEGGLDPRALEANLTLEAPELTVQDLPVEAVVASVWLRDGLVRFEFGGDGLGGRTKTTGSWPLFGDVVAQKRPAGRFRAAGFSIRDLLISSGIDGALVDQIRGVGAIDANVRIGRQPPGILAGANIEARDLGWEKDGDPEGGRLKAVLRTTPAVWQVDNLGGLLWGGKLTGKAGGRFEPATSGQFDLTLARADLAGMLAPWAETLGPIEGTGSLQLRGRLDAAYHVDGRLAVPAARAVGLRIEAMDLPLELTYEPVNKGGALQIRRWTARVAGGEARGNLKLPLGTARDFEGDIALRNLDLETIVRSLGQERNATGRLNGQIRWTAREAETLRGLRGKVLLDLDDASLFQLPVLSDIGRLLGSAQGGLFDDGRMEGVLTERQLVVERLTLEGRLAQLHATGTIGYNQAIDLEVLVATNQIIPQTGAALLGVIPGLNEVVNRRDEAVARIAAFLSNKLIKVRVGGTVKNPVVQADPSILVTEAAVNFFAGVFRLPVDVLTR